MLGTFFLTLIFSIEVGRAADRCILEYLADILTQTGLVASVVFSLILVIQKSTQTRIKIIGRLPNSDEWVPIDENDSAQEEFQGVVSRSHFVGIDLTGGSWSFVCERTSTLPTQASSRSDYAV